MMRRALCLLKLKSNPNAACKSVKAASKLPSEKMLVLEKAHSAHNYAPLPVVIHKAKGGFVWDKEGNRYFDFLSAYGAVSQGHVHPRLLKVAREQMKLCTLTSRAYHNRVYGVYSNFVTKYFGYEAVLPMNTGAEGVETALKLARKWGYKIKGIPKNQAIIVCCSENFHGRTFGAITMSDDPTSYENYGPLLPGFVRVKYGDEKAVEAVFKKYGKRICGFIGEPVQGEAGVNIPPPGFFKKVRQLCNKHKALMIADEVQSGCGRTGRLLAIEHEKVRPDIVVLAKALGGGFLPVAAVLADWRVMDVIEPGTHGSTFGGNPLACAIAIEALKIIHDEKLVENSAKMGAKLLEFLESLKSKYPTLIDKVRGRGLFAAIQFTQKILDGHAAYKFMYILKEHGLLAKTTHGHTLRLSPPLTIKEKELAHACNAISAAMEDLAASLKKPSEVVKSAAKHH